MSQTAPIFTEPDEFIVQEPHDHYHASDVGVCVDLDKIESTLVAYNPPEAWAEVSVPSIERALRNVDRDDPLANVVDTVAQLVGLVEHALRVEIDNLRARVAELEDIRT